MEESIAGPSRNNTETSFHSSTRVVRVHWLKFLFYSWRRISILSKFVISCYMLLVISQVATAIVILITSTGESCDQPLRTFIIVYLVRVIISCPFSIGGHFQREQRRLMLSRQRERDIAREEQVRSRRARRRASDVATNLGSSNTSIHSAIVQPQSNWIISSGEKLRAIVDLFAILWFIVGNYLLFTSSNCSSEAPQLYYTTLTFILLGYFILILPLILCTSAILCLPCVLTLMRALNITEISGMNQGARNDEISKIPVYRYRVSSVSTSVQQQEYVVSPKKPSSFFAKLLKGYRHHEVNDSEGESYEDMHISPVEDALCCICLSEYEDSDLICKLWCGHHYHRSCVTDWFRLNRKCPLCKQDFRGKEYDGFSEDDEESSSRPENGIQMDQTNTSR